MIQEAYLNFTAEIITVHVYHLMAKCHLARYAASDDPQDTVESGK